MFYVDREYSTRSFFILLRDVYRFSRFSYDYSSLYGFIAFTFERLFSIWISLCLLSGFYSHNTCLFYLLCVHGTHSSLLCPSFFIHLRKHQQSHVWLWSYKFILSNHIWFLSHFNSNLIFTLMKNDYVTRYKKQPSSLLKTISNNELVFTNNHHYYFMLFQIYIVYVGVFVDLVLFNNLQTSVFVYHL